MVAIPTPWIDHLVIGLVLLVATITDVRRRQVPLWLSLGFLATGLALGMLRGSEGLTASTVGLAAGMLPALPLVALGGFGGADLLLLGAIGAWEGWHFVLLAEGGTALAGAILALNAHRRKERAIPYVPAILIGIALAFLGG